MLSGHKSLVPDIGEASPLRLLYKGEALRLLPFKNILTIPNQSEWSYK